jgi:acylphosphatase
MRAVEKLTCGEASDAMSGEESETKAVLVRIEGRVQGVWYRGWTMQEAIDRRLAGWVRNRRDGSVEALFAGPKPAVDEMIEACWHGPPSAKVTKVAVRPTDPPERPGFYPLGTL